MQDIRQTPALVNSTLLSSFQRYWAKNCEAWCDKLIIDYKTVTRYRDDSNNSNDTDNTYIRFNSDNWEEREDRDNNDNREDRTPSNNREDSEERDYKGKRDNIKDTDNVDNKDDSHIETIVTKVTMKKNAKKYPTM